MEMEAIRAHNEEISRIARVLMDIDAITPGDESTNYKPLYLFLYNGITDIFGGLMDTLRGHNPNVQESVIIMAIYCLQKLQKIAEDMFIEQSEYQKVPAERFESVEK